MFYCCVPLCTSKGKTVCMHRFPNDEKLCKTWLQLLNIEKLKNASVKDLRKSYRVCDNHFNDKARISDGKGRRGSTIKADAVPSLHLPRQAQPEVNGPPLNLPEPNIVHVTNLINSSNSFEDSEEPCISENSVTFAENEINRFNHVGTVRSVGEHRCRTCLNTIDAATRIRLAENLLSGKTIKDVIVLLIPEMGSKLRDDEMVCGGCLQILESTSKFVQKCLEVEAILANQNINFAADVQERPVDNLNQYENIKIKEEIVHSIDGEHNYCARFVSVGIDESTDNPTNKNNSLDWGVDGGNAAKNIKAQYVHVLPYGHTIKVKCDDPLCVTEAAKVSPQKDIEEKVGEVGDETKNGKLSNNKTVKHKSKKATEKCSKCSRDIHNGFMKHHLEKHKREERVKLEREKRRKEARERASRTCRTCNESFGTKEELEFHLTLHPPLICDLCGKGFMKKESLRAHKNTHNAPNSFICEICGKGYKEVCSLRVHRRIHDKKRFKCPVCPKMFSHEGECNRHRKKVHQKKKMDSQCTMCGKMFTTASSLKVHIKLVHFREKPYECDVCHRKFGRADYLSNHKSTHEGESVARRTKKIQYKVEDNGDPVTCKFCGKLYKSMVALKRHLKTHFKRYACQFCPLTFCAKALSQRHEKIHEDGTVHFFRCNVCWRRFKTKEMLEEHSASHKNAQYACHLCDKTFNRRFLMNHHKLMNHMEKAEAEKIIFDSLVEANAIQSKD